MDRHSILTDYEDISVFSGSPAQCIHHLIRGRGLRELADADGLYIPLTNSEHNMSSNGKTYQIHDNAVAEKLSKMLGQKAWEENYLADKLAKITEETNEEWRAEAREAFRRRYGQCYL